MTRETVAINGGRGGNHADGRPVPVAEQGRVGGHGSRYGGGRTPEQERTYLRRHIAVNIVGENPPPLRARRVTWSVVLWPSLSSMEPTTSPAA